MTYHVKTAAVAEGKWKGILLTLGVPSGFLTGRHGPCPFCGGVDRFRFDNRDGSGSYYCNGCGAGSGMDFAMKTLSKPFAETAAEVDRIIGNETVEPDAVRPAWTEADRLAALREVAQKTVKVTKGDLVDKYLTARGVGEVIYPKTLRFAPSLRDGDGGLCPAMVATVQGPDGTNVSLHRTFLRGDGLAKAEMKAPRKLMPGSLPSGSCIRLAEYTGGALGIAEGIETAMSASAMFGILVWSAINATMLAKWTPPEGCTEVAIFGDNDASFAGQAAAYDLAHRLAVNHVTVTVHIPPKVGDDWNDVLMLGGRL